MKHEPTKESLQSVFDDWTDALNGGRLDEFWGYFHEESDTLDEDYPWRMTKEEIVDAQTARDVELGIDDLDLTDVESLPRVRVKDDDG